MGNVYVRFREQERASNALKDLTGRFFPGRLIIVGFSPVTDFCEATCKQYEENVCNRGGCCKKKKWQPWRPYRHVAMKSVRVVGEVVVKALDIREDREGVNEAQLGNVVRRDMLKLHNGTR